MNKVNDFVLRISGQFSLKRVPLQNIGTDYLNLLLDHFLLVESPRTHPCGHLNDVLPKLFLDEDQWIELCVR
jgi:hypothetical protein